MEWAEFSAALAAFLGAHVVPMRLRAPLVARFGTRAYMLGYSLMSLGLLYWLIVAAGHAPWVELAAGALDAVGGQSGDAGGDSLAATGGVAGLMAAFALWAGTHLIANGDLAHVLLFGVLLVYALFGLAVGLRRGLRLVPSWRRILLAILVWAALFHLHPLVIGLSPVP